MNFPLKNFPIRVAYWEKKCDPKPAFPSAKIYFLEKKLTNEIFMQQKIYARKIDPISEIKKYGTVYMCVIKDYER